VNPRPEPRSKKRSLSAVTRYAVVPLLLLAAGVRIGMYIGRARAAPAAAPAPPPPPAPQPQPAAAPQAPPDAPRLGIEASFQNNIYPSLLLSLGASYPEYTRCLSVTVSGAPPSGAQVRIESDLFEVPATVSLEAPGGQATLNPDLPWNYALLRRTAQLGPHSFVATLIVAGRPAAQAPLVCNVHSVNEVVSRIFTPASGQWEDTSVCFAAYVNEDHPFISTLLQDAISGGGVRAFTGYQNGLRSEMAQAQAVWDTLAARGLSYVNVATDSGASALVSTQYVRFLEQSLRDKGANCVDASVMFASILRRIGLRPVLIFRPGHCFAGFYDGPDGGHIVAFETTFLGTASFASAEEEGGRELQGTLPFIGSAEYSVVDIALCRQQGINPIPYEPGG
jgi:hypothetical protein